MRRCGASMHLISPLGRPLASLHPVVCLRPTRCTRPLGRRRENGGWGESYLSSQEKQYTHLPEGKSHVVNTAWAMLALIEVSLALH